MISLLFFLYFCISKQIFYYKISITIFFFNLDKIISNNNYKITTSLITDIIIYKKNLHIKKGNFRIWFNTILSYINLYNVEDELKYYYYYYLFLICSNFYPNKFRNILIILGIFLIYSLKPSLLSYINVFVSMYNILISVINYLFTKNKKYGKLILYLFDNVFYIEKLLIPKDNTIIFLYPVYYFMFLIYKHYQTKL